MSSQLSGRGRVLLADDDDSVRRPLTLALERGGFMVDAVRSGFEAAESLAKHSYDVVLADINMPGNEQLELLKERPPEQQCVPVVIITGYPSLQTAVDAIRLGVVDYVTKPVDPRVLFIRLDEAIQKGKLLSLIEETDRRVTQLSQWLESLRAAMRHGSVSGDGAGFGLPPAPPPSMPQPESAMSDILSGLSAEERGRLSPRERDVLGELARGRRVREVADSLGLSTNTVRNHLKSIFVKLGVTSQVQLLSRLAGRR